jgi:GSCFA family
MLVGMPTLHSRLGDWEVDHVHQWSERQLLIRAEPVLLIGPTTKVATIGSCFAEELASMMGNVGIQGAMHPGGLYYSTATIRQELERIAGGWPKRLDEPIWDIGGRWVDPYRDYKTPFPDEAALYAARADAETAADALFRDAKVVVVTLGLIETWRSPVTGDTYRQIPHPAIFPDLQPVFHRLTVTEMLDDLERIRQVVREVLGAEMIVTTSPVPLHATFTDHDVRVANTESKSRIRAAVSEFVDRHPDVHYFHSYEMVVTAERQSDFFRDDGRHVHRHAVRYIISEFLRLYGDPSLQLTDVDSSWLTAIEKTAAVPTREPKPKSPPVPISFPRRVVRGVRRRTRAVVTRISPG